MEAQRPTIQPEHKAPVSPTHMAISSQDVPTRTPRPEIYRDKPNRTPHLKSMFEWATFLITAAGLIVFWGQWNAAKKANDMNAANFRLGQRAWMGVDGLGITNLQPGDNPRINVAIKNFGQTTALTAKYRMYPVIIVDTNYAGYPRQIPYVVISMIRPLQASLNLGWQEHTIPPGKVQQDTEEIVPAITQEQYDMLMKRQAWLFAYGRIEYMDIFNEPHTTWFCSYLDLGSGPKSFAECGGLSSMK